MKITIEGKFGEDFPIQAKGVIGFEESIIASAKMKLKLRPQDEVILKVIE